MVFKLDEDLSPLVGEPLTSAGHDVRTVVGQGWSGLPEHEVWPRASAEGAIFVTADKGFSDLRQYPPGTHPGLVVLRPARESIVDFRDLLEMLLRTCDIPSLAGCLCVVESGKVRIRRPDRPD